ncbi:MAG: endo-1 4-beta-xylanase [Ignavibacteria bacterium]|nr:MAG: endo-1 4-beta-xylanase [Ignavibacteria bacterium]KAF0160859.1 MAG: endo-1 4-beta-xylanase [Ignavibacteria bacterium]
MNKKRERQSVSSCNIIIKLVMLITLLVFVSINNLPAQPLASAKSKFVGNIIGNAYNIRSDFTKYWNQVTPENASKWGSVEGTPGSYNWTALDLIYNFALNNNIPFKHHTLVWGQQYPSFVATLDSATLYQRIEAWIKICGERYPKTAMVDVVNEPLHAFTGTGANLIKALGGAGSTGWDWVAKAFELTRKYWPASTKLILNDYNIINSATKTNNLISIVNVLKAKGLIDGIGIQAHGFEVDGPSPATLSGNLDKLAATGIPIYITEFDLSSADDAIHLQKYRTIFPVLYEHPGVVGITLWGYVFGQTWRADAHLLTDRNAERPSLQWLRNYLLAPFRPALLYPVGTRDEVRNPIVKWRASQSATAYRLQISDNRLLTTMVVDTVVADTVFQCKTLESGSTYYWRVSAKNNKADGEFTAVASFVTGSKIVSVKNEQLPNSFELKQNYPNPFNPSTVISYIVPVASRVTLKVYDVLGREVATLVDEYMPAGTHSTLFMPRLAKEKAGALSSSFSSGVYLYRLATPTAAITKKMILVQ